MICSFKIEDLFKRSFIKDSELLKLTRYIFENYFKDELLMHYFINAYSQRKKDISDVMSADITDACICVSGENADFVKIVKEQSAKKYLRNAEKSGDGFGYMSGIRDILSHNGNILIIW